MAKNTDVSEIQTLLTLLIKALVKDKGQVSIGLDQFSDKRITFCVRVAQNDVGKVLGRGGRTANSLRVVLRAIGKEFGESMVLDIDAGGGKVYPSDNATDL